MVSWNVRALNDSQKRLVVRNLLREWKCDVVCLQEIKLTGIDRQLVCSIWSCLYVDLVALDVDQTTGGVLIMWDRRVLEKLEVLGVYGPNDNNLRGDLWDELVGVQQYWNVPWCCFGDFNIVRFPSERRGGSRLTPAMEKFSEFIEDLNLIDLPLEGESYTWSNGTNQPSVSRIDRTLVSHDWEHHFLDVTQRILPQPVSDHFPILLEAGGYGEGKKSLLVLGGNKLGHGLIAKAWTEMVKMFNGTEMVKMLSGIDTNI
ncbi:uncharacterized protein LOC126719499 [Quercus robur]|uniref:uncharacterized protein LOC126719499 n=1 Tax=Quercus robur TaxID=38942 RepID=UPI0021631E8F|nr:uncharacterized protein LOC126719499 [Quercus robur]